MGCGNWKLKNVVLKMEAMKAPGRNMAPRREMVFMAEESRAATWASLRCSPAIWKFSLDSFWAIMLYSYVVVTIILASGRYLITGNES